MAYNYELIEKHGLPLTARNTNYRESAPFTILEVLGPQRSSITGKKYDDGSQWLKVRMNDGEIMEILDRASGCDGYEVCEEE